MNPYDLSDKDNALRSKAHIARLRMHFLECTQFLDAIQKILIQQSVVNLATEYQANSFLTGNAWNVKRQKSRLLRCIQKAETLLEDICISALECGEIVPNNLSTINQRIDFVRTFLDNPCKLDFFVEELNADYYGEAIVRFFNIENHWQANLQ